MRIPPQRKLRVGNETVLLYANISQTGPPTTTTTTTLIVLWTVGFAAGKNPLIFLLYQGGGSPGKFSFSAMGGSAYRSPPPLPPPLAYLIPMPLVKVATFRSRRVLKLLACVLSEGCFCYPATFGSFVANFFSKKCVTIALELWFDDLSRFFLISCRIMWEKTAFPSGQNTLTKVNSLTFWALSNEEQVSGIFRVIIVFLENCLSPSAQGKSSTLSFL